MVVVGDARAADPVEEYAEWRHWCQRELCANGFRAVVVVHQIPTLNYLDHSRDLAVERVGRLCSRVREWNREAEEDRPTVVVVVTVVPLDQLVAKVCDVLADIDAQATPDRRDVARERLLHIELSVISVRR